jgi:hypothetical protein
MSVPRWSFAAVELADGGVLVVDDDVCSGMSELGGPPEPPGPADILDPPSGRWTSLPAVGGPRRAFVAVRLLDGRVLVAGGDNGWWGAYSSTKLFDPSTRTWSAGSLMGTARDGPVAAPLPDGRVLVAGGTYSVGLRDEADYFARQASGSWPEEVELTSSEIYDPTAGRWTATGDLPTTVSGGTAFALPDGRVLVIVPRDPRSALALLFDPGSESWATAASLPWPGETTATVLDDGSLLVIGGTDADGRSVATVRRFDPATGRTVKVASLPAPRSGAVAARLAGGLVLVAGGYIVDGDLGPDTPVTSTALIYDPATDSWTPTAPMPFADRPGEALTLADGGVLVTGGSIPFEGDIVDACDPNAVGWTAVFTLGPSQGDG